MTHPTHEQLVEFAYQELSAEEEAKVNQHLLVCTQCRSQAETLSSTMGALDAWKISPRPIKTLTANPGWKWAAAAAVFLTTAFAAGRMSHPNVDLNALAKAVEKPIRQSIQQEFTSQLTTAADQLKVSIAQDIQAAAERTLSKATMASNERLEALNNQLAALREEDRKGVLSLLQQLDQKHVEGLLTLRNDLETLAVQAESSIRTAQRQLVQLADYQNSTSPQN